MLNNKPLALVSLKSFGDFIIARWALRQIDGAASSATLLMGEHLEELHAVLGKAPDVRIIHHREDGVPAMFDMKKAGMRRGLVSAMRLRGLIRNLAMPLGTALVFDRIGIRERFIAASASTLALPESENVYLAYRDLLRIPAPAGLADSAAMRQCAPHVGIFPDSRVAAKALPAHVINGLVNTCREHGNKVKVFCLQGESCGLRTGEVPVTIVPRSFAAMAQAMNSVDAVISADSMPAHMAEYFGRPVFVVSPVANTYWLPLSCYVAENWSLFNDVSGMREAVHRFLAPCPPTTVRPTEP